MFRINHFRELTENEDKRFHVGTSDCYRVRHWYNFHFITLHNLCCTNNFKLRLISCILSVSMDERILTNKARFGLLQSRVENLGAFLLRIEDSGKRVIWFSTLGLIENYSEFGSQGFSI